MTQERKHVAIRIFCLTNCCVWPKFIPCMNQISRSQWPRGLSRRSAAARLLRSWVRIPPGAWIFVCCVCRVLLRRGLCDELITRPEESYRLCCVVVCDLETSRMGAQYIYDISTLRVNIHALISLYPVNTDRCTQMLLRHHCIKTAPHSSLSDIVAAVHNKKLVFKF